MGAGSVVRIAIIAAGIVIVLFSFWFLSIRKMAVDFAVIWEGVGVLLIFCGVVSHIQIAKDVLYARIEIFIFCAGIAGVIFNYLLSIFISCMTVKHREFAMEVSLLLLENNKLYYESEKELLIILPVKNEEENIGRILGSLTQPEIRDIADVLCINDASSDSSEQLIDSYQCLQIRTVYGLGYGGALQLGYRYAVRNKYRYVIQMDADGQHDVCNIPQIYSKLQEKEKNGHAPDIVLASRFMEGSLEFPISVFKKFAFGLFRSMIYIVTGRYIADPTTGLQGLSRKAFTHYSQCGNFDCQYPDANMIMQMLLLKFKLVEIPAVMHVRTDGKGMHSGLEPVWYMPRMFLSVLAVVFRIKVLNLG